ncbi:IMPACT family protein [Larsenimonas suaedae]|uniref:YigZ family protein n=1 Tax=Larsenimonas suaedae TaxID=1851019 RepID=A0ABU1GU34_9GAMM|nr:YigZ family protein [Larsenimonas suaedae]MCM2971986.1 YigZ family protein [Larsenimonas suaedae]MDR5895538.1 YigZ family protein [Larsenimonas suaedae]
MPYPIPTPSVDAPHEAEFDVQKSRFISWVAQVNTPDDAQRLLARARAHHPSARHHCLAFIAGAPGEQQAIGFSDDGEPGGTAGRPMYQALEGSQIGQIACVAIRYFGGIKLGTGGLARAYAKCVTLALETLPTSNFMPRTPIQLEIPFAGEQGARQWADQHDALIEQVEYSATGVRLTLAWPMDHTLDLSALNARLAGSVHLIDP